jgi:hypothetical protein
MLKAAGMARGFRRGLKRTRSRLRLPGQARRHRAADAFEAGERVIVRSGKKSPSAERRARQPGRGRLEREAGRAGSGGFGYGTARRTSAAGLSSRRPS